jgi:signal transduction histidine kinase
MKTKSQFQTFFKTLLFLNFVSISIATAQNFFAKASVSKSGIHSPLLDISGNKFIDFLGELHWGLAIGIGIILVFLIWKLFKNKNDNKRLKEMNLLLVETNKSLEKFSHITSHNLRAPVQNLISLTQMQKDDSLSTELKSEICDKIYHSVIQLDQSLNDLSEVLASKSQNIKIEDLNFEKEFYEALSSIDLQVKESEIAIETNFSECPQITYPKHFLNSIFLNLLTNAIKYRSMEKKAQIKIRTEYKMGQHILHFSDNGIGIDLEKHGDKIFGIYERFHTKIEGKGLGLYIVKSQIEGMKGKIEVDSSPGQGTSFRIYFNLKKEN